MIAQDLPSVIAEFGPSGKENRFLVISRFERPSSPDQYFPDDSSVVWLGNIKTAGDIDNIEQADFGILFEQLEHMNKKDGIHLLSRLRDQYCRRIMLHCSVRSHSNQELLALGFIEQERPFKDGRFYLFDPELFFERREWNTPDNWANPENFRKYRW